MPSSERWLLRGVRIDGRLTDCRIRDASVVELGADLSLGAGEQILTGRGGALLPGLADHHIHLHAYAAARRSIDLAGRALADLAGETGESLLRVIGAQAEVVRDELDALWPTRPVRVQHRSGALWTLNSAALALVAGPMSDEERASGQFWRASHRLRTLLIAEKGSDDDVLSGISDQLASFGVTHVTDATPDMDPAALYVDQHVTSMAAAGTGPRKMIIADHVACDLDALVAAVRAAHADGRGVALHAVTAASLAIAISALTAAGAHADDRIEHAAVCDDAAARQLVRLGVAVVTQPTIFARRGRTFREASEPGERDLLWRLGGLRDLGVRVALSSDAPYGDANPWESIRAAATRAPSPGADTLGPAAERLPPGVALASFLATSSDPGGRPRRLIAGSPADLCLLDTDLPAALDRVVATGDAPVVATFISGRLSHLLG